MFFRKFQLFKSSPFSDRKDFLRLIFVIFLSLSIIIGVYLALQRQVFNKQAAEGGIVDLKIVPDKLSVQVGGQYQFKIAIDAKAQRVTAASLWIRYDPKSIAIVKVKNEGFLPVDLKIEDDKLGNLLVALGSTVDVKAEGLGFLATITLKSLEQNSSKIEIEPVSEVSVSSREGNVLSVFPALEITPGFLGGQSSQQLDQYPNNLLLEKAFFADPSPFVQEFRNSLDPKPVIKPERIKPGFSEAYLRQLGKDIFIDPIIALNQVLEEKAGEVISGSEK